MRFFYVLFLLVGSSVNLVAYLPLPHRFDGRAVFYVKSRQLPIFCCGYNALFNACNMCQFFGVANATSNYERFKSICNDYIDSRGINPRKAVSNTVVSDLANRCRVASFTHLREDSGFMGLLGHNYSWKSPQGASKAELEQLKFLAQQKEMKSHLEKIDQRLRISSGPALAHFLCYITARGASHGVLITLVQNRTGRALYIFDNMNLPIKENSEIIFFIEFLIHTFSVSHKSEYKGPMVPSAWPSLPYEDPRTIYY